MTIKLKQTFRIPILGKIITRAGVLKPNQELSFHKSVWNEDGRGTYESEVRVKGLTPDSLEQKTLFEKHFPEDTGFLETLGFPQFSDEEWRTTPPVTLEKNDIQYVVDKTWGGKATGKWGQDIDINWEPILPTQAKK